MDAVFNEDIINWNSKFVLGGCKETKNARMELNYQEFISELVGGCPPWGHTELDTTEATQQQQQQQQQGAIKSF